VLLGITEYSRYRGCALAAVQYALKAGRIQRNADGLIDTEQADADWERNTMHTNARPGPKPKREAGDSASLNQNTARPDPGDAHHQVGGVDYAKARAAKEVYAARLTRLEFERRLGNLLPKNEVEVAAFNRFRVLRDSCLNIPNRIAAQLAAEQDPMMVHQLLEDEIRRVFESFARQSKEPGTEAAA